MTSLAVLLWICLACEAHVRRISEDVSATLRRDRPRRVELLSLRVACVRTVGFWMFPTRSRESSGWGLAGTGFEVFVAPVDGSNREQEPKDPLLW